MVDPTTSGTPPVGTGEPEDIKFEGHLADLPDPLKDKLKAMSVEERKEWADAYDNKSKNWQRASTKEKEELKSERESLTRDRESLKQQQDLLSKLKQVESKPTASQKGKLLDRLIDQSTDAEQRETLGQLRVIFQEESADVGEIIDALKDEVAQLKEKTSNLESLGAVSLTSKIAGDLSELKVKFGKDLIDTYQEDYRAMAQKYPQTAPEKVLAFIAPLDELSDAISKQKEELTKKEAGRRTRSAEPESVSSISAAEYERDGKTGRATNVAKRALERARSEGVL